MEARSPEESGVKRWTYGDLRDLPDDMRYELLDGVLYAQASASTAHAMLSGEIFGLLREHLRGKRCRPMQDVDVRFEEKDSVRDVVRPDVLVVCHPERIRKDGIVGAPTLVVEILSPSTYARDMGKKLKLYERLGVLEYWMVQQDDESEGITQCVLDDGKYRMEYIEDGAIVSTSIEGFTMGIRELYDAVRVETDASLGSTEV